MRAAGTTLVCSLVFVSCGCAASYDWRAFVESPPKSILVLPVLSTVGPSELTRAVWTHNPVRERQREGNWYKTKVAGPPAPGRWAPVGVLTKQLADRGYYVYPRAPVEDMLAKSRLPLPADSKDLASAAAVARHFGADAALMTFLHQGSTSKDKDGIESKVEIEMVLVSAAGAKLWDAKPVGDERTDLPTFWGTIAWIPGGAGAGFVIGVWLGMAGGPAAIVTVPVGAAVGLVVGMVGMPIVYNTEGKEAHTVHGGHASDVRSWLMYSALLKGLQPDEHRGLPPGPYHPDHADELARLRRSVPSKP